MKNFSSGFAFLILLSLAFFILGQNCLAAEPLDVAMIEIGAYKKGGYEYLKIYNNTSQNINLEGWKFVEGFSDSKLEGIKHSLKEYNNGYDLPPQNEAVICQDPIKFLEEENFFGLILDSSWGSLNESGERLQLLDNTGNIVEDFIYLPCGEGALKRINFSLADYSENNWQENLLAEEEENNEEENPSYPASSPSNNSTDNKSSTKNENFIIINEVMPNPSGPDNEKEFIELKNIGRTTINLEGWRLNDNSSRTYIIKEKYYNQTFIRPGQFFVIYREKSKIALNNSSGDEIKLYNKEEKLIDKISYKENAEEEQSYALNKDGDWLWSLTPTSGKENIVPEKNENPIALIDSVQEAEVNEKIYFDASDSYDPDGDELFFIWDFGDNGSSTLINPTYSYKDPGEYEIILSIFDSRNASSTTSSFINITNSLSNPETIFSKTEFSNILINEIFPNPAGRDDEEFIELYNPNNKPINLSNWTLQDNSAKEWKIPEQTIIEAGDYFIFYKEETRLTLNNNHDSLKLIDPAGEIVSEIFYENAEEEISYSLDIDNNEWHWTYDITPEEENKITKIYEVDSFFPATFDNFADNFITINLGDNKKLPTGETVEIIGVVSVEPGILGKQIFYLNGLQIYMYKKDFPELKLGDKISLIGELTESRGEKRIKIKNKEDIIILKNNEEVEAPEINIDEIDENMEGRLATINGEIVERKGSVLWLDDNTNELPIYINKYTGISLEKFSEGQKAEITGIIRKTKDGFRLFPRYSNDIILGQVLGNTVYASENYNPLSNEGKSGLQKYNKYIFITLLGAIIILINLFLRRKKTKLQKNEAL